MQIIHSRSSSRRESTLTGCSFVRVLLSRRVTRQRLDLTIHRASRALSGAATLWCVVDEDALRAGVRVRAEGLTIRAARANGASSMTRRVMVTTRCGMDVD